MIYVTFDKMEFDLLLSLIEEGEMLAFQRVYDMTDKQLTLDEARRFVALAQMQMRVRRLRDKLYEVEQ